MKTETINERVKFVMKEFKFNERNFASRIGINPTSLKNVISNGAKPSLTMLDNLVATFPVRMEWLVAGTGKPFTEANMKEYMSGSVDLNGHRSINSEINNRLKEVRVEEGRSQAMFASDLKVSRDVVSCIETDKTSPSLHLISRIRNRYGYSYDWIIDGKGPRKMK